MSSNRSRVRTQTLPLALASAALLCAVVVVGCGDSPTGPSSVTDVPTSSVDEIREFSGLVELPGPTTMDLSLRIQRQTADATPVIHAFFATLFAQEIGVVSGTYTLQTDPPREGEVEGTLVGPSFLTAGQFDGVLTQNTGDCTARRRYSGPVTATGINWVGGSRLQPCPSAPLAGLSSIGLTATGTQTNDPGPDPERAPAPDQVFTLTVLLAGSGNGTVASSPSGIDCGSDCTELYPEGTAVTLTPTSAAGSIFADWSGDEACSDGVVTMDADHGCTVTFDESARPSVTLTITLGGSGSGSVTSNPGGIACGDDCSRDFAEGTAVTLTPTASSGSLFGGWTGHPDCNDGQVTMDATRRCTAAFDVSSAPTNTLTVARAGIGSGTVTSSPGGISCGGDCSEDYPEGTAVTLLPTADAGSTFVGWSGAGDCSDGGVTMNANRRCTATFNLSPVVTFTLTVSQNGSGSGTVTTSPAGVNCGADCTESYEEGTIETLIPNPDGGSTFGGWSGGADCVDGSLTMIAARSCTATFDVIPPNMLAVTLSGTGSGTVTSGPPGINCGVDCSEMYSFGTVVTLTPTPDVNSTFGGWTGDPDCTDGSVTMDAAHGCTATFTQITHPLTVITAGSGMGTVTSAPPGITCGGDCTEDYPQGTVLTLTPSPSAGSVFDSWSGDADSSDGSVTMAAPRSCTATFIQTFALTITAVGNGSVTSSAGGIGCPGDCIEDYPEGTPATLSAVPAMGWTFFGWSGDPDCSDGGVTMNGDRNCIATFNQVTHTLTITQPFLGLGSGSVAATGIACPSDCVQNIPEGNVVALTANPDPDSLFFAWGGDPDCTDGSVTMNGDRTCTVQFDLIPQFTLTVTQLGTGGGTVTSVPAGINCGVDCDQLYDENTD